MSWTRSYLGIPWVARGRDRRGIDCWGLVRLVYREQARIELPEHAGIDPADRAATARAMALSASGSEWREIGIGREESLDVVLINEPIGGKMVPAHIGIVTRPGHLIHVDRAALSVELPFRDGPTWRGHASLRFRIAGIYRHRGMA